MADIIKFIKCDNCPAEVRETRLVSCGGCGIRKRVCLACRPIFVTCAKEECKVIHRQLMKEVWNKPQSLGRVVHGTTIIRSQGKGRRR